MMVQRMVRWWAILLLVVVVERSLKKKYRILMMVSKSSMGPLMNLRMVLKKNQMMWYL